MSKDELKAISKQIRRDIIQMINKAGSGHPGGSLSATDIMTALYFAVSNLNIKDTCDPDRDRIFYSKAHVTPLIYSLLARRGYFDPAKLTEFRKFKSNLQGHPYIHSLPGIESSGGSLGQGISVAVGSAITAKRMGEKHRIFCLLGDGEQQEGEVWEAYMSASHYKLDNLTIIIDKNRLEIDGFVKDVMNIDPLSDKLEAFGFEVFEVDGHDFDSILDAYEKTKSITDKPQAIIANTIKGKGVSFMEDEAGWHGKAPDDEQTKKALSELS